MGDFFFGEFLQTPCTLIQIRMENRHYNLEDSSYNTHTNDLSYTHRPNQMVQPQREYSQGGYQQSSHPNHQQNSGGQNLPDGTTTKRIFPRRISAVFTSQPPTKFWWSKSSTTSRSPVSSSTLWTISFFF